MYFVVHLNVVEWRKREAIIVRSFKHLVAGIIIGAITFGAIPAMATYGATILKGALIGLFLYLRKSYISLMNKGFAGKFDF